MKLWLFVPVLLTACASAQETLEVSVANNVVLVPLRVNDRHCVGSPHLYHPTEVCHKCKVPFDPMSANLRLFNTSPKRFRAGLVVGKPLILQDESTWGTPSDSPTLNQEVEGSIPSALTISPIKTRVLCPIIAGPLGGFPVVLGRC
jgi:hypothetical protein